MSSESLTTNINYNVIMDRNISILSNQSTISPEELYYVIDINDAEIYTPNDEVYISDIKEQQPNNFDILTIIKIISVIVVLLLIIWFCFLYN
jgi:hypothetical protein